MRILIAALLLAFGSAALAQDQELWSVQTVALRDLREARDTAAALRQHGFDAYTEFAMDDGLQFVRVRIGCFVGRDAAEAMAEAMRGRVTDAAVPVELTPGAPVRGCVSMVVGFLKPFAWDAVRRPGAVPAFQVEVAGVAAHVVHTGVRWRVLQEGEEVPRPDPALRAERFSQTRVGGVQFVRVAQPEGDVVLCPGALLASIGSVAISEREEALVACSLETMREP